MIKEIVCHIDESLKAIGFINECLGIAELITTDETPAVKCPAVYQGKDSLTKVDFDRNLTYHRITGPMPVNYLEADDNGVTIPVSLVYPMVLVACIDRNDQTDIEIVQKLMYELSEVTYTPLKSKIKFQVIRLKLISSSVDRYAIWGNETDGAGLSINFDKALVSINYQIEVNTYTKCLNNC